MIRIQNAVIGGRPRDWRANWRIVTVVCLALYLSHNVVLYFRGSRERLIRREAEAVGRIARLLGEYDKTSGIMYVRGDDGPVVYEGRIVKCTMTGSHYVWASSTAGRRIPLDAESDADLVFFAHSATPTPDGERCFVFPMPLHLKVLHDSQVDWNSQRLRRVMNP